jgi:5'-nucleotidase
MRFLVVNDDGIHAPGIKALASALKEFGHVDIVAPHAERSAQSHAISVVSPLRVEDHGDDEIALTGTPADCVMFALQEYLEIKPDWVVSGINRGGNLATDLLYSGTVAAAMEACILGYPALAVSLEGVDRTPHRYDVAASIALDIISKIGSSKKTLGTVINLNVPNVSMNEIKGVRTAFPGRRFYEGRFWRREDPRNIPYYWVGAAGYGHEDIEGSDCNLVADGYASVSVLKPSFYDRAMTEQFERDFL